MTVSTIITKSPVYTGDGINKVFGWAFQLDDPNDLEVYVESGGAVSLVSDGFTVTGAPGAEGNVTFDVAPMSGDKIVLLRQSERTQGTDYPSLGKVATDQVERDFDRRVLVVQEAFEKIDRAPLLPPTYEGPAISLSPPSPGRALIWSEDGSALLPGPNAEDIAGAQANAAAALAAQALAELAADAVSSYAGAGVSLARVSAAGNDSEAANAAIQLASGARYYPVPFATIQGATAATMAGDVIHVTRGIYTETFALKGGRTYQCDPGVVLANCVLTYDGDTAEGPLDWRGAAQVIRTTEPLSSFNIDDGRNCVLELLGGVRDENYAATTNMIDWNRTNLHLRTGHCSTVARTLFSADDQWNDQAMLGKSVLEALSVENTYATRNTSSTDYILIRADRGSTLDVYVDSITTTANEALGIGSVSDPGTAKKTAINFKRGRIDTPNQAALFYSSGADSGSEYVLTLSNGVVLNSGSSFLTRKIGAASNPRIEVHGVATASSGPDSAVAGPTTGILQIEGAL